MPDTARRVRYDARMTTAPARAITLRPPWAWAVVRAGKRIENRSWPTSYRGSIYIHAGCARITSQERASLAQRLQTLGMQYPDESEMARSAIVAVAILVGCVRLAPDQLGAWAVADSWHWLLEDVHPLEQPIAMPGRLGLWRLHA